MTSIAKTARMALAVAVLALATAGAASADAFHPHPFLQRGVAPADVHRPADYARPAGSSWSSIIPAGWKWAPEGRVARFHLTGSGCNPRCMI